MKPATAICSFFIIAIQTLSQNAHATVSFQGDWNLARGGWGAIQAERADSLYKDLTTWHGKAAARVTVKPGDDPLNLGTGTERAEVLFMNPQYETASSGTVYYGLSYRFPTDWISTAQGNPGDWSIVFQLHGPDTLHASPAINIYAGSTSYSLGMYSGNLSTAPYRTIQFISGQAGLNLGKWTDFIVEVTYKADATGKVVIWRRNEGQTGFTKACEILNTPTLQYSNTVPVGNHYWKQGLYRGNDHGITNVFWIGPTSRATTFAEAELSAFGTGGSTSVGAEADSYVRGGAYGSTNYGTAPVLTVKNESGADYQRESYLRFDLSGHSTPVLGAKLRLTVVGINTAPVQNTLYFVGSDTWTESGITWNTRPTGAFPILGTWTPAANSVIEVDVTSQVNAEIAGDKKLSLKVASTVLGSASNVDYGSKENSDPTARPVLVFTSSVSPEADALVRGGTYASTNYGTDSVLTVKNESGVDYQRESYLKFDVSGWPAAVSSAKLRLTVVGISTSPVQNTLYFVSSDTWTESGITWNNKPAGSTTLGSWTPSANAVIDIDVTSQVNAEIAGDNKLSLKVASTILGSATNVDYGSSENTIADARAVLLITP